MTTLDEKPSAATVDRKQSTRWPTAGLLGLAAATAGGEAALRTGSVGLCLLLDLLVVGAAYLAGTDRRVPPASAVAVVTFALPALWRLLSLALPGDAHRVVVHNALLLGLCAVSLPAVALLSPPVRSPRRLAPARWYEVPPVVLLGITAGAVAATSRPAPGASWSLVAGAAVLQAVLLCNLAVPAVLKFSRPTSAVALGVALVAATTVGQSAGDALATILAAVAAAWWRTRGWAALALVVALLPLVARLLVGSP